MVPQSKKSPESGVAFLEFLIGALLLAGLLAFFMTFELKLVRTFRAVRETHRHYSQSKEELHGMLEADACSRKLIEAGIVRTECRKGSFILSHYGGADEYP